MAQSTRYTGDSMIVHTPGVTPFYDQPGFLQAAQSATRQANNSGQQYRIVRSYGQFAVHRADAMFYGMHIAFVNPDKVRL